MSSDLPYNSWMAVASRCQTNERFLAHTLRRRRLDDLADALQIPTDRCLRLLVCYAPRADQWDADINRIADYIRVAPDTLAKILRESREHDARDHRP